jgi:prepilin-type N-terminal cleavage/methylation domain-containing protein
MNTNSNKRAGTSASTRGFTIIEVVLVLAIAALIFLMIFIALPALQRGQRDTARKQDVGTVASAINTYRSNHRGSVPADASDLSSYIDKLSQVATDQIKVTADDSDGTPTEVDTITINTDAKCKENNEVEDGSAKQATVRTLLENGGVYCQDV